MNERFDFFGRFSGKTEMNYFYQIFSKKTTISALEHFEIFYKLGMNMTYFVRLASYNLTFSLVGFVLLVSPRP